MYHSNSENIPHNLAERDGHQGGRLGLISLFMSNIARSLSLASSAGALILIT